MSTALQKSFTAKFVAGIAGAAMALTFAFGGVLTASAQSNSDLVSQLQQQIQQLQAQLAELQGGDGGSSSSSSVCPYTFTRNLTTGDTGQEVMKLQMFLNDMGFSVASSGAGSPGNETTYFGSRTAQAVTQFQNQYSADVLAPVGLSQGTGYWGPSSRSKANALCTSDMGGGDTDGGDTDGGDTDGGDNDFFSGQEGSIDDFDVLGSPGNEDLQEGEKTEVMGFEFEADGSDLRVERVDVMFEATNQSNGDEPYDYIDEAALYHEGEKVAEMDVSSQSDWSEQDGSNSNVTATGGDSWRLRFANFETVVSEGDTDEFTLELTANDNLDSGDLDQEFTMYIADDTGSSDGIRAVDQAGVNQYAGSLSDTQTVTFEGTDAGQLTVREIADPLDERVVEVDETSDTNDVDVLTFEIEAEDQDIEIQDLDASTTISDASALKSLSLWVDGEEISSENFSGSDNTDATTTFEDIDYVIEEDEEVEFTIKADLDDTNDGSRYSDGVFFSVDVNGFGLTAEEETGDGDNITSGNKSGSAAGEKLHLYATAPTFELTSMSEDATQSTDSDDAIEQGEYTFKFTVNGDDDEDIYIPVYQEDGSLSIVASTTDGSGSVLSDEDSTTTSVSLNANDSTTKGTLTSGNSNTNTWRISAGSTGKFTLKLTYDNAGQSASQFAAGKIQSLKWATKQDPAAGDLTNFDFNLEDWETDTVSLDN